jgi:hypothetical protein
MSSMVFVLLLSFVAAATAGCKGVQEVRQSCTTDVDAGQVDGGYCPPCKSASDCEFVSNSCHASGACAPKADGLQTTQEGCANPYEVPEDPCDCVEGNCVPK